MKGVIIALLIAAPLIGVGQKVELDRRLSELTNEIKQYENNYKRLALQRGQSYLEGDFTAQKMKYAIREYCKNMFDEEIKEFKFIFYHYQNDSLSIWVFNSNGDIDEMIKKRLSSDSLITLETTLKFRLNIEQKLSASRGDYMYEQNPTKYRLTSDQAIAQLTNILLPDSIVVKLSNVKYLLILPCLNISSLPYGMLRPWKGNATLIDSMSYSFAHNLSEFFSSVENKRYDLVNPVIVGNPKFSDSCTFNLPNLPGAELEAREVAYQLETNPYIGEQALKSEIVTKMGSSTFIYFATHGYSDQKNVMQESFIALYEPAGCGFLTPTEIQNLSLSKNAIVVLSACETGNGRILDAGIIGLARGFLKANAKAVIMSLWKVDDQETKKLMLYFIEELGKEQVFFPAENLRHAILRYKQEISYEPIYWAAFQVFGTPMGFFENSIKKKQAQISKKRRR